MTDNEWLYADLPPLTVEETEAWQEPVCEPDEHQCETCDPKEQTWLFLD